MVLSSGMAPTAPTLTVALTNYNHGGFVGRAIEAIVSQSRPPDQFLIYDDGSTDDSVAIIETYAKRHPLLTFIRGEVNVGVVKAMQRLLAKASGDYVYWAAADDMVLPEAFAGAMPLAEAYPEAGIIFGQMATMGPDGKLVQVQGASRWSQPTHAPPERYRREFLEVESPMTSLCSATVFRRAALEAIGYFRPELGSYTDTFTARALGLVHGACYTAQPIAAWRLAEGSLSQATTQDPLRLLDIMARAAWLMRSPEFREHVPPDYVQHWEERWRDLVIHDYCEAVQGALGVLEGTGRVLGVGSARHRLFSKLFNRSGKLEGPLLESVRQALAEYAGDVTCYG